MSAVSKSELREWLKEAKENKATHCIIVCDSFSYEDYPVSVMKGEDVHKKVAEYNASSMQRVMEVYNLKMSIDKQLNSEGRVFNY